MKNWIVILTLFPLLFACRGKKESIYLWKGEEESRRLSLFRNNVFVLEISTDYYSRTDTGTYRMRGDTLIINPDRAINRIDSIISVDSLFSGQRFLEVLEEEIEVDTNNAIVGSYYRAMLFPSVLVNDTLPLTVSPGDPSFRKLIIPDSLVIQRMTVTVPEDNTCRPSLTYRLTVENEAQSKSYRIYLPSRKNRSNYLAGFKWLIRGDTIESFFANDDCESLDIKMVRNR